MQGVGGAAAGGGYRGGPYKKMGVQIKINKKYSVQGVGGEAAGGGGGV